MGRIKTTLIKRNTLKLLQLTDLTTNFDKNKKAISGHIKVSKKIRNAIAGYAARINSQKKKKEEKEKNK